MIQIDVELMALAKRHGILIFGRKAVQPGRSVWIAALLALMKQVDERRASLRDKEVIAAQYRARNAR